MDHGSSKSWSNVQYSGQLCRNENKFVCKVRRIVIQYKARWVRVIVHPLYGTFILYGAYVRLGIVHCYSKAISALTDLKERKKYLNIQ